MFHGTPLTFDVVRAESELLDSSLKYHHLIADHSIRHGRTSRISALGSSIRSFLSPSPEMREERI